MKKYYLFILILLFSLPIVGQALTKYIVVDQFGYRPVSSKVAVIRDPQVGFDADESFTPGAIYQVINVASNVSVFQGSPIIWNSGATNMQSGDKCWWFDFSSVTTSGSYYILDVAKNVKSFTFDIRDNIYFESMRQAARALYYQRAGFAKVAPYASAGWVDGASHLGPLQDKNCRLFSDKNNPATERDLSGGWYDAGDLNQYSVNASVYCIQLSLAYRENPTVFGDNYNIPESGNGIPDILDENKWELDWLVRMQQSNGSVLCVKGVHNISPPSSATHQSLYGPATTNATFAGAAAYAISSITYAKIPSLKTYADQLKIAAIKAWDWGVLNPDVQFHNNSAATNSIGLAAGDQEQGYNIFRKIEAAGYLYQLTGDLKYRDFVEANCNKLPLWIWGNFVDQYRATQQDFLMEFSQLPGVTPAFASEIRSRLLAGFNGPNDYIGAFKSKTDPYRSYINSYNWGTSSYKLFYGTQFYSMAKLSLDAANNAAFITNAEDYIHYIHGVNPLNILYMTNMGSFGAEKSVTQIFHSWFKGAKWDQVGVSTYGPPPGFLPMGPNPGVKIDPCCASNCSTQPGCNSYAPWKGLKQPDAKAYLDMNDDWPSSSWEISEVSIGSQVDYIRLVSKFVKAQPIEPKGPYTGTAIAIPGTIEGENYDKGGQGVSYNDTEAANLGGAYRTDGVDIGTSVNAPYNIGWTMPGEWLEYSVNVTSAGSYDFEFFTSSFVSGGTISLKLDGNALISSKAVPVTNNWDTYTSKVWSANLPAGNHLLRVNIEAAGFNLDKIVVRKTAEPKGPFTGTAIAIPGTIEGENYDKGGQGVSYNDTEAANLGGAYRTDGVDIGTSVNAANNVGWTMQGEWLEYSVNVISAGNYDFEYRTSSAVAGGMMSLNLDGNVLIGSKSVPLTNNWDTYTSTVWTASLPAGAHVLRVKIDVAGFNLDKIIVRLVDPCLAVSVPTISAPRTVFCQGESVVLTSSAGASYKWFNGAIVLSSTALTLSVTTSGSYAVEVTSSNGCKKASSSTSITVTPATTWYSDADGDGSGNPLVSVLACTKPAGYVSSNNDLCPSDINKVAPGLCGCGIVEATCGPIISFSQPLNGASTGKNIIVIVNSTSNNSTISNVKLYLDGSATPIRQEGTAPYIWNSTNGGSLDPVLSNLSLGAHTLRAVSTDNAGKVVETSISITVTSTARVGAIEVTGLTELVSFPNPFKDKLSVEAGSENEIYSARLTNMEGIEIQVPVVLKGSMAEFSTEKLSSGVYVLELTTYNGKIIQKVMKQ